MNKELLVKQAFEGYVEMAEDENKIIVDLNGFDYLDECKNEDGQFKNVEADTVVAIKK